MYRSPSVTPTVSRAGMWGAIGLMAIAVLAAGSAHAQSASGTLSAYKTGYGGASLTGLESPVSPSLISSGSQYTVSDGVNQAGSVGSLFDSQTLSTSTSSAQTSTPQASTSQSSGAGESAAGVGQAVVSTARAPLAVVETTTATTANLRGPTTATTTQTKTATPSAGASAAETAPSDLVLNGKLNLDGGQ
jgi:hypothetical protein